MNLSKFVKDNWKSFLKYSIVGVSGTAIDIFGFTALLAYTGLTRPIAATISFVAAVINNYTWNKLWTFKDSVKKSLGKQFAEFFLVSIIGLALNVFFLEVFARGLMQIMIQAEYITSAEQFPLWGNTLAKLGASGVVLTYNFLANRFWTFKRKV